MNITLEDVKDFSELSKPIIEPLINSLVKPHIDKLNKWLTRNNRKQKIEDNFWENKFKKYLEDIYRHSLSVTTLVFPNSQTSIKDIYIPLTLVKANSYERFVIDTFNYSIFKKYNKIIISDFAGMGKSTILKWITNSIIEQNKSIPILIELRKISNNNSIIDEIFNQLNPIGETFDKELVYELLELGFFTILLDGFDEIPYDLQDMVTIQLIDFVKKTNKNNFILTSRPESALSSFSNFQLFYIKPLDETEAEQLIEKLDNLSKIKFKINLINEIREKNTQVQEFLTNPLLVSLLYKSYTYNKDIPSKKITFYEEVYSCLFKHHDLSKEGFKRAKKSNLDIYDFEIILRDIAFETSKVGRVIYSKDELINHIILAKGRNSKAEFREQNFYDDLTTTVPIFATEGIKIKWAHKSIQDFFSAKYISNHSKKEEILEVIYKSGKFHFLNILDLLYELEYKLFRKKIIKPILEKFIEFYDQQFPIKPNLPQSIIDERIALTFGAKFCLLRAKRDLGFDKARELFSKAVGVDEKNFKASSTFHQSNDSYYTMSELTLTKQLIKLLKIKNEKLFIENDFYRSSFSDKELLKFSKEIPYVIDDDLNKPYNNEDIFEKINGEITTRLRDSRGINYLTYNLDYEKCKNELVIINNEIQNENEFDLFNGL